MNPPPALVAAVRERLSARTEELTPVTVAEALRASGQPVGDAMVLAVYAELRGDVLGAGLLEPLLRLPGVTDVLVNGPSQVFIDRGDGLELTEVRFADDEAVRRLAQRLAATGGRRLDDATPCVDVRLADRSRLHAVLAPVARPGTTLSLRVPSRVAFTLADLQAAGSMSAGGSRLLRRIVAGRLAFLVTGGTGSGKTTLLGTLLSQVAPTERIVIVEDSSELAPQHPHLVSLEARPPNVESAGEITVRHLLRQALRMRPDRVVVGEVRGAEVVDLLAALNTGHEGGCGTLHANSAADVPARIEALALAAGLPRAAAHSQLAAALDAVVHLTRDAGGRRVSEVAVPVRDAHGLVSMALAVSFDAAGRATSGPGEALLAARLERAG